MKIILVRPQENQKKDLDALLGLKYPPSKYEIQEAEQAFVEDHADLLAVCSEDLTTDEREYLKKNHLFPVILLSEKSSEEAISEYNIYRTSIDVGSEMVQSIKEGLTAKNKIDSFLRQHGTEFTDLDDLIQEEINKIKTENSETISAFEAFYRILESNPDSVKKRKEKKLQNLRIGMLCPDDLTQKIKSYIEERKVDFRAETIDPANVDLSEYDIIISSVMPTGDNFKDNYAVPIILLSDDQDKDQHVFSFNIYDVIPTANLNSLPNTVWAALKQKFELDKLNQRFKNIANIATNKKRIYEEQFFVKHGDHGRTKEEETIYGIRGDARQISAFEASYLIAMEEIEKIKAADNDLEKANLLSFYGDLFRETKIKDFAKKSLQVWKGAQTKHLKKWLAAAVRNLEDYPEAAAKLFAQYITENPDDPDILVMKHRHNITKIAFDAHPVQYIIKFSRNGEPEWLLKEKALLYEYNRINNEISKKLSKNTAKNIKYVQIPSIPTRFSKKYKPDFLMFEAAPGKPAFVKAYEYQKDLENCITEEEEKIPNKKLSELACQTLRENSKIIAMAYLINMNKPELVESVHFTDPSKTKKYHAKKIDDKFVGNEDANKEFPEFEGGLLSILPKNKVEEIRASIFENMDPILDIVANASSGIYTDRTLRNCLKTNRYIYEIDFETLRNMPTLFDVAGTIEMGFASNEQMHETNQDIYVNGELIYKKGSSITTTQKLLTKSITYLEEELTNVRLKACEYLGENSNVSNFSAEKQEEIISSIVPTFEQCEKEYYACAAVTDMIAFGTAIRFLFTQKADKGKEEETYKEENARLAYRCLANTQSNILQLKRFYTDESTHQKLDNLAGTFYSILPEVKQQLKKWHQTS